MNPLFIAEVKTHSPFGFVSEYERDFLFDVANEYGDWVSIHTNPRWQGSFDWLEEARRRTEKPILAKGIHRTDDEVKRAVDIGADYVLVVGRMPQDEELRKYCIFEPLSLLQLRATKLDNYVVWNSRDLADGEHKTETFNMARERYGGRLCQASNLRTIDDVHPKADAYLVGQNLIDFIESVR